MSLLFGMGCGGTAGHEDDAFRRIQVHEAAIANAAAELEACVPDEPCPAAERTCAAAQSVCEIADGLDDADAATRCEVARRRCPEER